MAFESLFESNRAQNNIIIIAMAVLLILGAIAATAFVFDGIQEKEENTPNTQTKSPTETTTQTGILSPTQVTTHTPTRTPITPTLTAPATSASTATLTQTITPTPEPNSNELYGEFVATVYGEAEVDTELSLRIRGWTVVGDKTLVIAMNLTTPSEADSRRVREVNTLVTSGYAQAVAHYDNGNIDGKIPNQLRVAEVNNTGSPPMTLHVNTSLVREYYAGQRTSMEFSDQYWGTARNQTYREKRLTRLIDRRGGNITIANNGTK